MPDIADLTPEEQVAALRDLLASPGWRLVRAFADHEWGPRGYGHRMQEAVTSTPGGAERAYELADAVQRVHQTAAAVNALIAWPEQRLRILTKDQAPKRMFSGLRRT